jgi:hypothetical protein
MSRTVNEIVQTGLGCTGDEPKNWGIMVCMDNKMFITDCMTVMDTSLERRCDVT